MIEYIVLGSIACLLWAVPLSVGLYSRRISRLSSKRKSGMIFGDSDAAESLRKVLLRVRADVPAQMADQLVSVQPMPSLVDDFDRIVSFQRVHEEDVPFVRIHKLKPRPLIDDPDIHFREVDGKFEIDLESRHPGTFKAMHTMNETSAPDSAPEAVHRFIQRYMNSCSFHVMTKARDSVEIQIARNEKRAIRFYSNYNLVWLVAKPIKTGS